MSRFSEELIEQIRAANDIVDVVGEYVQLKKQGRNYFGLCPFHQENSPSFSVSEEKQIFHCFGCGKGGNVITFIMEIEGMAFHEALRFLADKAGIDLPETDTSPKNKLSEDSLNALGAYEWLTKLYKHMLKHGKDGKVGLEYLHARGLNEESIDKFQIGLAPSEPEFVGDFLEKKGFHPQLLIKSGLLSEGNNDKLIDRFRGRVIFPIRNHLGKTVAFGGRAINGEEPKYLNSPESELFQKSKLLYNFDLAKKDIRKSNEVVLCEGYLDVIAADKAGVPNVVATLGTALTEFQARLLRRYVETVILCYDADSAGMEATYKAGLLLQKAGCEVKVANLKEGMDPDSFVKEYGSESFKSEVIQASDTFNSFYMRFLKRDYNLSLEGDRIEYIERITKWLAMIERSIEREYYLKELGEEFDISLQTLMEEVEIHRQTNVASQSEHRPVNNKKNHIGTKDSLPRFQARNKKLLPAFHNAERMLLAHMLQDTMIAGKVQEKLGASFNIEAHQVMVTYLYAFYETGGAGDISMFIEKLPDAYLRELVTELAMIPIDEDISDRVIDDYIYTIQLEKNDKASIQTLKTEQKLAEKENDPVKAAQIAMQIIDIQKKLKEIN